MATRAIIAIGLVAHWSIAMCRAGLGSNTQDQAQLWEARAHQNLEPSPGGGLRFSSASLGHWQQAQARAFGPRQAFKKF